MSDPSSPGASPGSSPAPAVPDVPDENAGDAGSPSPAPAGSVGFDAENAGTASPGASPAGTVAFEAENPGTASPGTSPGGTLQAEDLPTDGEHGGTIQGEDLPTDGDHGGAISPVVTPDGQVPEIPRTPDVVSPGGTISPTGGTWADGGAGAASGPDLASSGMATSVVSAYIMTTSLPIPPIVFSFNPEEYSITTKGRWNRGPHPATNGPTTQWGGMEQRTLTVKLLMDMFSVPPVPPEVTIKLLKMLCVPTPQSMLTGSGTAPIVTFGWGANVVLTRATVDQVEVKYERFLLGVPVRATATIKMTELPLPAPLGATNPTSGGLTARRTHRVVEGDTLASIAYREYNDPNKWRALAEVNHIDDPMRVKSGTVILVPDQREAESYS